MPSSDLFTHLTNSSHEGPPSCVSTTEQRLCQSPLSLKPVLPQLGARFLQRQQGRTKLFSSGQACMEDVALAEPLAGLGREGWASLGARRCSGAAAATSSQERGVTRGHGWGRVWLSVGRGKEISYLEHLLLATEAMGGGSLRREEGRAAARWFPPPRARALCKLTLLLLPPHKTAPKLPGGKSLLSVPDRRAAGGTTERSVSKEQEKPKLILSPPRRPPSPAAGLGFSPAPARPHGGKTGGQRLLPPPLQLVRFPTVVFSGSSALPHAVRGPEQTVYHTWSLNYLTVPPFRD